VISRASRIEVRAPLISELYATKETHPAGNHSTSAASAASAAW
jgi:hypothetical protein